MSVLGEIIAGAVQCALEVAPSQGLPRWRAAPPRPPTEPTAVEFMAMAFGGLAIFLAVIGLCVVLHQWSLERLVLREAPTTAVIVSIDRRQTGDGGFVDVKLDYECQTPAGSIACRNAPARIRTGSEGIRAGMKIEVYAQPASCSQATHAPDIGNPRPTLLASATAFPIGSAMIFIGYAAFRGRQHRLGAAATKPGAVDPRLPGSAA